MKRALAVIPFGLFLALGCGGSSKAGEFFADNDTALRDLCACTDDEQQCLMESLADPEFARCQQRVLDARQDDLAEQLDCLVETGRVLLECLDPLTCDQDVERLTCVMNFQTAANECPPVPADVNTELQACGS